MKKALVHPPQSKNILDFILYVSIFFVIIGILGVVFSLYNINKEKDKPKFFTDTSVIVEKWRQLGDTEIHTMYNEYGSLNKDIKITIPTQYYIDIRQQDGSIRTVNVTESYWNNLEL